MVRTRAGFAVCLYGVSPCIPVRSSSRAGLVAGSERSGIGGLPHVAGVSCENVGYRVYTAQGNLERITALLCFKGLRNSVGSSLLLDDNPSAAFFASPSTSSLPLIPMWPAVHLNVSE